MPAYSSPRVWCSKCSATSASSLREFVDWGDHFLVTVKLTGHGAESGASVHQKLFSLCTLRRGLVVRQYEFLDRAEALEAAGVAE